eukprot:4286884-Pyramimonas_sp.AAC.1
MLQGVRHRVPPRQRGIGQASAGFSGVALARGIVDFHAAPILDRRGAPCRGARPAPPLDASGRRSLGARFPGHVRPSSRSSATSSE